MTDREQRFDTAATYTVSELCGDVRQVLQDSFDSLWVVGEVQRARPNRNGHLYFELVEKGNRDDVVGKLEAVIWRRDHDRIRAALEEAGQQIADGREMRCRASLDLYAPFGRLQLVVREVDVVFALGQLAARRRETLQALTRAGLLELNGALPLAELPLDLALVTARGSAAYHDFLETLRESGYGFRITVVDAAMQGRAAEGAIASALAAVSRLPIDACVLIRGGGSKTDLAAFDSRQVAEAVARCRVPVLTGLGHQIDESIADRVAHSAFKTPTRAAEFLVERVEGAAGRRADAARHLVLEVRRRLAAGAERLRTAEARVLASQRRLIAAGATVEELGRYIARTARRLPAAAERRLRRVEADLGRQAPRALAARRDLARRHAAALTRAAEGRLRTARATLDGTQRLAQQLGPDRVLARGFSITRDAGGRAVRRAEEIRYGQVLTTQLARGSIKSRVEE